MKSKPFLPILLVITLSACAAPPGAQGIGTSATLPPAWTPTPEAVDPETPIETPIGEEVPVSETSTPSSDTDIPISSEPGFEGADQWWLRIPDASFMHASGTSDGAMLMLLRVGQGHDEHHYAILRMLPDGTVDLQFTIEGVMYPGGILETLDGGILVTDFGRMYKFDADGIPQWARSYGFSEIGYGGELFSPVQDILHLGDRTQITGQFGDIVTIDPEGVPIDVYLASRISNILSNDEIVAAAVPDGSYTAKQESRTVYKLTRRSIAPPAWVTRFDFITFDVTLFPPHFVRGTRDGGALFLAPAPHLMADGGFAILVARLDRSGNVLWQQIYEGIYEDDFFAIETSDGGFLIANTDTFYGNQYSGSFLRITRFNRSGNLVWDRVYGDGETQIQISQIIERPNAGFFLVGEHGFRGDDDIDAGVAILSVDPQGRILGCKYLAEIPYAETLGKSPSIRTTQNDHSSAIHGEVVPYDSNVIELTIEEANVIFDVVCTYPAQEFVTTGEPEPKDARVHAFTDGDGQLIGGVRGNQWYSAVEIASQLTTGSLYRLYNRTSRVGDAGAKMGSPPGYVDCPGETYLEFSSDDSPAFRIALDADWNAIPQIPTTLSSDIAVYTELLDEWLKPHDVWNAALLIDEAVKVDVQGDGADEVLIFANNNQEGMRVEKVTKDDYSLLLLRRIGADGPETIPLYERYVTANGSGLPVEIELVSVLDLNGDGVMEIIAKESYYTTSRYLVFDLHASKPEQVLETSCAQLGGS